MTNLIFKNKETGKLTEQTLEEFLSSNNYKIHKLTKENNIKDVQNILLKDPFYSEYSSFEEFKEALENDEVDLNAWNIESSSLCTILDTGEESNFDEYSNFISSSNQFCIITQNDLVVHSCMNNQNENDLDIPYIKFLLSNYSDQVFSPLV